MLLYEAGREIRRGKPWRISNDGVDREDFASTDMREIGAVYDREEEKEDRGGVGKQDHEPDPPDGGSTRST